MKTVSNRITLHHLSQWQKQDRDPNHLLRAAGIAPAELHLPHGRIDAVRHSRLLAQVAPHAEELVDSWPPPTLATLFSHFSPLASLCCNAASWRQALHYFLAFHPLIGECDEIYLEEDNGLARVCCRFEVEAPDVIIVSCFADLSHLYALLQFYHPGQGCLVIPASVRPALAAWPAGSTQCGDSCQLHFSAHLLDLPYHHYNRALQPLLLAELDKQMGLLRSPLYYRDKVLALIRRHLWLNNTNHSSLLSLICETLKLTRWTLNRHLREEGCHFSALLDQVRREEACRLLCDPTLQLQEVGEQLGFGSHSSFTRFFKDAFDISPSQYRANRHRGGMPR